MRTTLNRTTPAEKRTLFRSLLICIAILVQAPSVQAFSCIQWRSGKCVYWNGSRATLQSYLGSPGSTLLNGTTSWDQNAISAAADWNGVGAITFTASSGSRFTDPCGAQDGRRHMCTNTGPQGDNPIFFASTFCGEGFGDAIEVTNNCWNSLTGEMFNAPVFVSANVAWDAYDGNLRFSARGPVYDIRRVLLHEFGHVLGLAHPDEAGQSVGAIMNSHVSNLDRLQADDVDGARFVYSSVPDESSTVGTSGCALQAATESFQMAPLLFVAGALLCLRRKHQGLDG